MSALPFLDAETIDRIREIDLLTYLEHTAPDDLCKRSTEYRLHSQPRFAISHGKWYDFDSERGGVSALDFFVKIRGMPFLEAAHMILQGGLPDIPIPPPKAPEPPKPFILPERNNMDENITRYLTGRGIHPKIVRWCIDQGLLYESKEYSNCVFVGYDPDGVARYAMQRGTLGDFRQDVEGSVKRYGFHMPCYRESDALTLFESPIDALSHTTLHSRAAVHRLSLGGTSSRALMQYIADHPNISTVIACLDNDEAGRKATATIRAMLPKEYEFIEKPPPEGKDYNEYLQIRLRRERCPKRQTAAFSR